MASLVVVGSKGRYTALSCLEHQKAKVTRTNRWTDRPTGQPIDGHTHLALLRLKHIRLLWSKHAVMVRKYKMTQVGWVHMHTTSKQIELESSGCSGFENISISIKTYT